MSDLDDYFREVQRMGLGSRDEVLARVLHVDGDATRHAKMIAPSIHDNTLRILERLDFAIRTRNPGVHYVRRSTFLGYRREGAGFSPVGARSQIFLSVVPKVPALQLVFVPPEGVNLPATVENIGERGHHGVGTHQCTVRTAADVDAFTTWFCPPRGTSAA